MTDTIGDSKPLSGETTWLDLFGPTFKSDPYPTYARMRRDLPAYRRTSADGQSAVCFFTRYDDVAAILRDNRRFVKDVRNIMTPDERAQLPPEPRLMQLLSHHMLNTDAPDHNRLRSLVNQAFTGRIVEQMEGRIQDIANRLLDRVIADGHMDLIADYAFPLPTIVIAELLGIPSRDRNRFRNWSSALVAPSTRSSRNTKKLAKARQLMEDFIAYLSRIFAERRNEPKNDLITSLLQAEELGDVLSEQELYSMILLLIVVGHETTVNLIGNGMLSLFRHPTQFAQLSQQLELLPQAIEEMIRYDCPVERAPMRFAAEDVEIHGQQIRRGDAISLVLGSANRDPAQIDGPDSFNILRADNKHLGFGLGIHYCLGAPLARLEGRIGIGVLLERLPGLHLAADPASLRWRTNPIMRGVHKMPVHWEVPAG